MKVKILISFLLLYNLNAFSCTCPKFKNTETGWAGFKHAKDYMTYVLLVEKSEAKSDRLIFKVVKDYNNNYRNKEIIILDGNSSLNCSYSIKVLNSGEKYLFNIYNLNDNDKKLEFKLSDCFESFINVSNKKTRAVINSNNKNGLSFWTVPEIEKELNIKLNASFKSWYYLIGFGIIIFFWLLEKLWVKPYKIK